MDLSLLPYGAYVAFAFSCILFGGLAYRQVIDMLELRSSKTGEDLDFFMSASGVVYALMATLVLIGVAWMAYSSGTPSIWLYALPLIGLAQLVQLSMRLYFQRMRLRTRAIVIRYVLRSGMNVIEYDSIQDVEFVRRTMWTEIRIGTMHGEHVAFRIFRFSEQSFQRRLYNLSGVVASNSVAQSPHS
ncbi:MAG: hypothetical protein ACK5BQ_06310 [Ignavibacteria bacterium]